MTERQLNQDDILLAMLAAEDEQAMVILFDQYYDLLFAVVNKYVSNTDDTDEVIQELLINIWNKDYWDDTKIELVEQFKVMLTNRANKVLGICEVSTGGISGTVADPKLIFAAAIKAGACGIILAHNHPSGNLNASQADIDLTRKMREGGKLLEIQLLDHLIVTSEGYYSFADEGLL